LVDVAPNRKSPARATHLAPMSLPSLAASQAGTPVQIS
jgi:hypothetical protein